MKGLHMRSRIVWLSLLAALAAVFVAVATIVQAVRQGSWAPVIATGWVPAVIVAAWPATCRRCWVRRRGQAG
jgi:hypothetical protein